MQNAKLHTTTCPGNAPETELYRFGADGNLRLYSYDRLFFALYGYDGGTTRTYKYSFDLKPQWVNGRLEAVNFNMYTAMFYPNSYLNFNSNGYYTKHYYNGMERIASRLGDNNLSLSTHDPELQDRKWQLDSNIRRNIVDITGYDFLPVGEEQTLEDPKPIYELPVIGISNLLPSADGIYYYHSNHLGSTCYVSDENRSVVQGFLYAPFGEITNEYNNSFGNGVIPKYSFNAKELDEETGMYYYEARYYQPPVFTSRDPLFEKYPTFSPYAYCANNPVMFIDPTGNFFQEPPKGKGAYKASVNSRYVGFGIRNPRAAMRIGFGVTSGASDISTNATRFATRGEILFGSKRSQEDRCSENGAFRHVLWQATITSEFGRSVAAQAGNAHEENPYINLSIGVFSDIDAADQSVDLLNNIIGRQIGETNKGVGMQKLAMIVLEEFFNNGLFTATGYESGCYVISRTKITYEKYAALKKIFEGLNDCGRTPQEQEKADMIMKQKLEDLQTTWGTMK